MAKARIYSLLRTPTMKVSEEEQPEPYFRNSDLPHLLNHRTGILYDFLARDPEAARNFAIGPESIPVTGATFDSATQTSMNTDAIAASVRVYLVRTPFHRENVPISTLTEEQTRQTFSVAPSDYWQLSCWTCRGCGHSTFTCPTLTPNQRMYFAYRYYLDQIKENRTMAQFLEQKTDRRVQIAKERAKYDVKHSGDEQRPHQPPDIRDEAITDRVPWRTGPMNDITALMLTTNVEATATAEVSAEDVEEEEEYISATDGECT